MKSGRRAPKSARDHEHLEAWLPALDQCGQHVDELGSRRSGVRMKEEIGDRLRPYQLGHSVDGGDECLIAARPREGTKGRDAAGERGPGAAGEIVDERRLEVCVRIDAAGNDEPIARFDDADAFSGPEAAADLPDLVARDSHVHIANAAGVHDAAATDEQLGDTLSRR